MTIDQNKKKMENSKKMIHEPYANHKSSFPQSQMMTFGKNSKKIKSESSLVSMGLSKIDYEGIGDLTD